MNLGATAKQYSEAEIEIGKASCQDKLNYGSWEEAERAALVLIEDLRDGKLKFQKKGNIMAYRCDYCPHWHIGHATAHAVRRACSATGQEGWEFGWQLVRTIGRGLK